MVTSKTLESRKTEKERERVRSEAKRLEGNEEEESTRGRGGKAHLSLEAKSVKTNSRRVCKQGPSLTVQDRVFRRETSRICEKKR